MIQIKGQYNFADFQKAYRLNAQRGNLATWAGYFFLGILVLGIVSNIIYAPLEDLSWYTVMLPVIFLIVFAIAFTVLQYVIMPRRMARTFKQQKDLSAPFEIELSDEGFHLRNEYGSSRLPWVDVVKWKENDELLLLYRSDVVFHLLPKRFFHNASELQFMYKKLGQNNVPKAP